MHGVCTVGSESVYIFGFELATWWSRIWILLIQIHHTVLTRTYWYYSFWALDLDLWRKIYFRFKLWNTGTFVTFCLYKTYNASIGSIIRGIGENYNNDLNYYALDRASKCTQDRVSVFFFLPSIWIDLKSILILHFLRG